MSATESRPDRPRFDVEPNVNSHFAWLRTVMALQNTLMAATRTSISLIGFGFTVAQFFEKIRANMPSEIRAVHPDVPRDLGLILIGAGVVTLAVFTWQYQRALKYLQAAPFDVLGVGDRPLRTSVNLTAAAVLLIGVAAFISIFLRF
jgi:putative membrane protein